MSPDDPTAKKSKLEIEKLEGEIRKLGLETDRIHGEQTRWSRFARAVAPLLTALTTAAAVGTLAFNYNRDAADRRERAAERDATARAALTSELILGRSPAARRAALRALLASSRGPAYEGEMRPLLVEQLVNDPDDDVRLAVQLALVDQLAGLPLISALAEQNRELQRRLAASPMYHASDAVQLTATEPFAKAFGSDTALLRRSGDLGWNIRTLIRAINAVPVVEGVDLSGVALSRPILRVSSSGSAEYLTRADEETLRPGVRFVNSSLARSDLTQMRFDSVEFRNVRLDSARIAAAVFRDVTIDGASSLRALSTAVFAYRVVPQGDSTRPVYGAPEVIPAVFQRGVIRARDLTADLLAVVRFDSVHIALSDTLFTPTMSGSVRVASGNVDRSWRRPPRPRSGVAVVDTIP